MKAQCHRWYSRVTNSTSCSPAQTLSLETAFISCMRGRHPGSKQSTPSSIVVGKPGAAYHFQGCMDANSAVRSGSWHAGGSHEKDIGSKKQPRCRASVRLLPQSSIVALLIEDAEDRGRKSKVMMASMEEPKKNATMHHWLAGVRRPCLRTWTVSSQGSASNRACASTRFVRALMSSSLSLSSILV